MLRVVVSMMALVAGMGAASAQDGATEIINSTVKYCVNAVHNMQPNEQFMAQFYKGFDAYYNPASKRVFNNATTVGAQQALFYFQKCMVQQGMPLD